VAELNRGLLLDHHQTGHPPRQVRSVEDLIGAIEQFIDGRNKRCRFRSLNVVLVPSMGPLL
jgi:hypothetical protein